LRANGSSSSYHVLPTSTVDLHDLSSPPSSPPRRIISFGSKRQQKQGAGYRVQCSSRRWTRVLLVVTLVTLLITLLALPARMNPFRSRVVWVRYYTHEESVKVVLPFGKKVHVSDVKATAMQAMAFGYQKPLGQVKLISRHGEHHPGQEWEEYGTNAWNPIIAVETNYELHEFLNSNLHCFTSHPSPNARFTSEYNDWGTLYNILDWINTDRIRFFIEPYHIQYLRKGFDDPQAYALIRDMTPFISKQRNPHTGFEHPSFVPSQTMWQVQPTGYPGMIYEDKSIVD
ncbi:hypothetical protein BGZ93_010500, partial [Podila epicladia]